MNHRIVFESTENYWDTALPLGNGKFGAMVFYEDQQLHLALNHYDIYYAALPKYAKPGEAQGPKTYNALCESVFESREGEDCTRAHYGHTLNPAAAESRPKYSLSNMPVTGEIQLPLTEKPVSFSLVLNIEAANVVFSAQGAGWNASAVIWIAKTADILFAELVQSRPGLWGGANPHDPCQIVFSQTDNCLAVTIKTKELEHLIASKDTLRRTHSAFWKKARAAVTLPDKVLETLWFLHLYLIDCASGLGGKYAQQACGLNGLWDIRRPALWPSEWYWDVNIQAAFWPVFSANRLELAKHFCDSYLSYEEDIAAYTRQVYGVDGWALDYPHTLYNCIQPWCAQFLWRYYEYSGDMAFLREKAYPVFQKQIAFFKHIAKADECGILHIDPDISPEQGPVTRDSVITTACIKQLLKYAIAAAKILNRPESEGEDFRLLLAALPPYTLTADNSRLKDSPLAPEALFLRHPSVLMPIFPGEELSRNSPEGERQVAMNTLNFAMKNTETGVFGFGWLACAAAVMGEGTAALRVLYEEGLDHILHANGLGYEESDRFINHCLVTKPPLYAPAMTEPSGEIVMAVNTMLLQSGEAIEVFPAVPNGQDNLLEPKAQYAHFDRHLRGEYPAWEDCGFQSLLAPGGFEVSAERRGGLTVWIHIKSTRSGTLRLLLPKSLSETGKAMIFTQELSAGTEISFGDKPTAASEEIQNVQTRYAAFTHRRVTLGSDCHTAFYNAVDAFTCAAKIGNEYQYPLTRYIFDFSAASSPKNYDDALHRQFYKARNAMTFFEGPRLVGLQAFNADTGYGFAAETGLCLKDRTAPDSLRRDFAESDSPNEFCMALPRGAYKLLIVSGDEQEESQTHIHLPHLGGKLFGEPLLPGHYQCKTILFMQERDGIFRVGLDTGAGRKWKLNALFLNRSI